MSTLCIRHPGSSEGRARGWAISLVIHGLVIWFSIALVTSLRLPPDPNVFRWKVALVEPPEPAPQELVPAVATKPTVAPPKPDKPANREPVQAVQPVEKLIHQRPMAQRQLVKLLPESAQELAEPVPQVIDRILHAVETPSPVVSAPEVSLPTVTTSVVEGIVTTAPHPGVQEAMAILAPPVEHAPILRKPTVIQESRPGIESRIVSRTEVTTEVASLPTPIETRAAQELKNKASLRDIQRRPTLPTKSDYSWLPSTLEKAIGDVRLPDVTYDLRGELSLKIFHGELKIYLEDVHLTKSTGHAEADRIILEKIKKVFPMKSNQAVQPAARVHTFSLPFDITYQKERKPS